MKTFPIMLDIRDRLAVVVGGGDVGVRKARSLADAGAKVRIVAKEFPGLNVDQIEIQQTDIEAGIELIQQEYEPILLDGAIIVFACTNDRVLNSKISSDAKKIGSLVCAVDQPEDCQFFSPAVIKNGDVLVTISTGGKAPAMSGWLKKRISSTIPEQIAPFAKLLIQIRDELKLSKITSDKRASVLKCLACDETYEIFVSSGQGGVRVKLNKLLEKNVKLLNLAE